METLPAVIVMTEEQKAIVANSCRNRATIINDCGPAARIAATVAPDVANNTPIKRSPR